MKSEKGTIIVRKSKKGKLISEILIENVKKPMVLPKFYERFDESLNNCECQVVREKGQIVQVFIKGKEQTRIKSKNQDKRETKMFFYLPKDTKSNISILNKIENFSIAVNHCISWGTNKKIDNNFLKKVLSANPLKFFNESHSSFTARYKNFSNFLKDKYIIKNFSMHIDWRLVVGLGAENVKETSMTLHHIYGIPYIPGSALKGIARDTAIYEIYKLCPDEIKYEIEYDVIDTLLSMPDHDESDEERVKNIMKYFKLKLQDGKNTKPSKETVEKIIQCSEFEKAREIFGTYNNSGKIVFFDAQPQEDIKLKLDIINPHYPKYYRGTAEPTDYQKPNPIKFLTVENTSFNFFLGLPKKYVSSNTEHDHKNVDILELATKWVKEALQNHGVGAKTSVGYGFFH